MHEKELVVALENNQFEKVVRFKLYSRGLGKWTAKITRGILRILNNIDVCYLIGAVMTIFKTHKGSYNEVVLNGSIKWVSRNHDQ